MHVRDSVANAYGRALEAFEWICEVDTAKPVEQIRIPRATTSGSYQNLDSKLNAALQQIVSNIGGLHFYCTCYTPTCHWSTSNSAKTLKAEHLLNKFRQDTG